MRFTALSPSTTTIFKPPDDPCVAPGCCAIKGAGSASVALSSKDRNVLMFKLASSKPSSRADVVPTPAAMFWVRHHYIRLMGDFGRALSLSVRLREKCVQKRPKPGLWCAVIGWCIVHRNCYEIEMDSAKLFLR